jgi:hypothetical protein
MRLWNNIKQIGGKIWSGIRKGGGWMAEQLPKLGNKVIDIIKPVANSLSNVPYIGSIARGVSAALPYVQKGLDYVSGVGRAIQGKPGHPPTNIEGLVTSSHLPGSSGVQDIKVKKKLD